MLSYAAQYKRERPYLNWIEERSTKPTVVGSSPAGRAFRIVPPVVEALPRWGLSSPFGVAMAEARPVAFPTDWLFYPDWLTLEQASYLSGWDRASVLEIIDEGGVDLNTDGLIENRSLHEFQEMLAIVLHWNE